MLSKELPSFKQLAQGYYVPPISGVGVHIVFGVDSVGVSMKLFCV